ncbi:MAG: twin-arginine translocation signal domain-containing protein [Succinivibrio sp.]
MSDKQEKELNQSRRNFLKGTAAVISGITVAGMIKPAFASNIAINKVDLDDIPSDPVYVAKSSELVNRAWSYLLAQIKEISDASLRGKVMDLYQNTIPTFMKRYQSKAEIASVYKRLLKENLVDASKTKENELFPPLKDINTMPQPFFSAPGSGYASHHSYPGGLVTHTAVNVEITKSILNSYKEVMGYEDQLLTDTTIAAQLLHDLAKPWVFTWKEDGSSLPEYQIAGTGAHHIFSIAESIERDLPAMEIVAQACAHNHPGTPNDEASVVAWIKAASVLADVDPVKIGLLSKDGTRLPTPHCQAGYMVHLGDHDFVLSVPAAVESVNLLKEIALHEYGMSVNDLNSEKFNHFRNYIASQVSFMHIHKLMSEKNGVAKVVALVKKVID